ncbi:MAG: hypothetical protein H7296_00805 [Bacteroidia bacterium]|nr:hypothetical protein [Bacteroidia bacterium]
MNKNLRTRRIVTSVLLLFTTVSLLYSCKNPIEGFALTLKADYTTAPNTFRILDAKTNAPASVPAFTEVKITGKDAGLVFEPSGSKIIKMVDGAIQLAFRKGVKPTKTNPLLFNIVIEVEGYLPLIYPVEICSVKPLSQNISLVNMASLPLGTSLVKSTVTTDNGGKMAAEISIKNNIISGKNESSTVTIPMGTQMQEANGVPITGNIEASVIHFTGNSTAALNSFPGGLFSNKVKTKEGITLPAGSFNPVSWIVMDMTAGNKVVKKFSKPVSATMELSASLINPVTKVVYKEGDGLTIWSRSNGEEFWIKESVATVAKNNLSGKLEVTMQMTHLSAWAAANFNQTCEQDVKITITNNDNFITRSNIAVSKNIDGSNYVQIGEFSAELMPGSNIINLKDYFNDYSFTANDLFKAVVTFDGATPLFIGPTFFCGATIPVTLPTTDRNTIDYKLSIKCNQNFILLPDNYKVYYIKEADYQNTIINEPVAHKVNPYDLNPSGQSYYKQVFAKSVTGNANFSMISLLKSSLVAEAEYRCIIYYQNQRYDKKFMAPLKSVLDAGQTQDLEVTIENCPL